MRAIGMILFIGFTVVSCKRAPEQAVPIEGWHQEEGWRGDCYYPPNFSALTTAERRMTRQTVMDGMLSQWVGDRDDGMGIDNKLYLNVETVMLGKPERIEQVVVENLEQCQAYMQGGDAGAWESWLVRLPGRLTEGECPWQTFDYTLFDYLDIQKGWQIPGRVCKGDRINVQASTQDYYQIEEGGPLMNADGDSSRKGHGDLPCNHEGCLQGQLLLRFTAESGIESVVAIGLSSVFEAPDHGTIHVMINDNTWYDNIYKTDRSIIHHTSIGYKGL